MDIFPSLQTKRLKLRQIGEADVDDLFRMRSDPAMILHIDSKPDETLQETKAYMERMNQGVQEHRWLIWAMEHVESKKVIGTISVWNYNLEEQKAELGYGVIPSYQRQGYVKEAILTVIPYAFENMGFKKLEAYTETNNLPSKYLLDAAGFRYVEQISEQGSCKDRVYLMDVYEITN